MSLAVCGVVAAKGEKKRTAIAVPGSSVKIPMTIINGTKDGPLLLLMSGIHGSEYPGIAALIELGRDLVPSKINGAVVMLHPVNVQAFWERRDRIVPEDAKNLNRVFPGKADGTLSERIADLIVREFFPKADFFADLHSGDINEDLFPYVYYPGQPSLGIERRSKKIAMCLDLQYMVRSLATNGAYNYAATAGLPSILIERGCLGCCHRPIIDAYKKDIMRIFSALGMSDVPPIPRLHTPRDVTNLIYLASQTDQCWFSRARIGSFIHKGKELGYTTDFYGENKRVFYAEQSGVVLYRCSALSAQTGTVLVAYGALEV